MEKIEEAEDFINLGIVLNDKREVLMVRRAIKEKGKDGSVLEWAFPGGKQRLAEGRVSRRIFYVLLFLLSSEELK